MLYIRVGSTARAIARFKASASDNESVIASVIAIARATDIV